MDMIHSEFTGTSLVTIRTLPPDDMDNQLYKRAHVTNYTWDRATSTVYLWYADGGTEVLALSDAIFNIRSYPEAPLAEEG